MKGRGIEGTCQSCLLLLPLPGSWNPAPPPGPETLSAALPRFEIGDVLGKGAIGEVYAATDRELRRAVAIKIMSGNPDNPEFAERFSREAEAMAKLNHPNIVTVYDYGATDALHYLVMERMDGGTLDEEMGKGRRLPVGRALQVFGQICDALHYAHSQGVIHRDVKPSNILLDGSGRAKLSDFGLVKGLLPEEFSQFALTRTRAALGTPLYMAPEQMDGSLEVDHRADIYSAGAVLYEMLTGQAAKSRDPSSPQSHHLPPGFASVMERALHPSPEKRYPRIYTLKEEAVLPEREPRRWAIPVALLGAGLVLAISLSKLNRGDGDTSADNEKNREAAIGGLPLGRFEDAFDPADWISRGRYEFEGDTNEKQGIQDKLKLEGTARIENGELVLDGLEDRASAELARDPGEVKGLAFHVRFQPERYLAFGKRDQVLVQLHLQWNVAIILMERKWSGPILLGRERESLAPQEVIRSRLNEGDWHELWIVAEDRDYRIWIDGEPTYHSTLSHDLEAWKDWTNWSEWGETRAKLEIGGFRGKVDVVEVWEKR